MIYSRLSNEELERWVNASPADTEAKAELLSRVNDLMDNNDADLEEAHEQLIADEQAHSREIDELNTATAAVETELDEACQTITELEAAAGMRSEEIEKLEADAAVGDEVIARLRGENNNLRNRIAELTHAEDLV